jgi:hypothetical protein
MELTIKEHLQIFLIKAGIGTQQRLANLLNIHQQNIYNVTHTRRTRWIRQRIFEILQERLPNEVRGYTDVWIDENRDAT